MEKLHSFQSKIVQECLEKKRGGLALPMGSGKTLVSLCIALKQCAPQDQVLIVASKSLIQSWEYELEKFFPDTTTHTSLLTEALSNHKVVLTTPSTLVKFYKKQDLMDSHIQLDNETHANHYLKVKRPLGEGLFYGKRWGVLIIDEVHNYTNISTVRCRSLLGLCTKTQWLLSGTIMPEPKLDRIFGYHLLVNDLKMPRNLPEARKYITKEQSTFKGMDETLVSRDNNDMFTDRPDFQVECVKHALSVPEQKLYLVFAEVCGKLVNDLEQAKTARNINLQRTIRAEMLTIISHLRIFIVAPMVTLSRIFLNAASRDGTSIVKTFYNLMKTRGLEEFMDKEESLKTSRVSKVLEVIHAQDNRTVVFSSFRMNLDYINQFLGDRQVIIISSKDSADTRGAKVKEFNESDKAIMLLTYAIGADGLNLQGGQTVLLLDHWWNKSVSEQAIARVYRFGQKNNVKAYVFSSETGIEKGLLDKHMDKGIVSNEIRTGPLQTKVRTLSLEGILKLV